MQNFIYIPAEGERPAKWLNLSIILKVVEHSDGALTIWNGHDEQVGSFKGKQSDVLRAALSPSPKEPMLPQFVAAQRFDARLKRRGQLTEEEHWDARHKAAGGISDCEYFDRHTVQGGSVA